MKKIIKKKWFIVLASLMGVLLVLFLFRYPILRGIGDWLVAEDPVEKTDVCFVLGGNSYERGLAAVNIWEKYPDQLFVTTGGNHPLQIQALDTLMFEAELTKHVMTKRGISADQIQILTGSRSTQDESNEILSYCKANGLKNISVVSSAFHLRRVKIVFKKKFEKEGIVVRFNSAEDSDFERETWWKDERSLITVNNEYIKLVYYFFRH